MAFLLLLGGVSRKWRNRSVSIVETLGGRSTAECQFDVPAAAGWAPYTGQSIEIWDAGTKIFGGSLETVEMWRYPGNTLVSYRCSFLDHHRILDRRVTGKRTWTSTRAGQIVRDICIDSLTEEGVDLTFVVDGPIIEKFEVEYVTVAEAISQVAQLARYWWFVDYDRNLRFFAPDTYACPFELFDGSCNFTSLVLRSTREQYANRILLQASQYIRDAQTATFDTNGRTGTGETADPAMIPDGARKLFVLSYPVAEAPTIEVNNVAKTVGIYGVDTGRDWYWNKGIANIDQDDAATPLGTTDVLEVTYRGQASEVVAVQNTEQIDFRKLIEGGSGKYEAVKQYSTEVDSAQAAQVAAAQLDSSDEPSSILQIALNSLQESLAPTARVGQRINVVLSAYLSGGRSVESVTYGSPVRIIAPAHGRTNGEKVRIFDVPGVSGTWTVANATADEFDLAGSNASDTYVSGGWIYPATFLIRQIRKSDIPGTPHMDYMIEAISGAVVGDAVDFFRNLGSGGGSASGAGVSGSNPQRDKIASFVYDGELAVGDVAWLGYSVGGLEAIEEWAALGLVLGAEVAPVGQAMQFAIERFNPDDSTWVEITKADERPMIAAGNHRGISSTWAVADPALQLGDLLRARITQLGTVTPGDKVLVQLEGRRRVKLP